MTHPKVANAIQEIDAAVFNGPTFDEPEASTTSRRDNQMTDSETQRQRHLAEMLIAQCNGKQVQYRERDGVWIQVPYMIYNIADSDKLRLQWRIKPEPREWWICVECNQRFTSNLVFHNRPQEKFNSRCDGQLIHVREVLSE